MNKIKLRKPQVGEVVSFVLDSSPDFGKSRPAKIIEVFETHSQTEYIRNLQAPVLVNLKVFTENIEDEVEDFLDAGDLKFSRCLNLEKLPGTWHFPETVSSKPLPNTHTYQSRIRITLLGVFDEAYPDRVILPNRMVFYI